MFLNVAQRPFITSNNIICEDCGNMNINMLFLDIQWLSGGKVEPYPIINSYFSIPEAPNDNIWEILCLHKSSIFRRCHKVDSKCLGFSTEDSSSNKMWGNQVSCLSYLSTIKYVKPAVY